MRAKGLEARRQRVYKAALDNMAGEAVGGLFATMADRAMGIDVDSATAAAVDTAADPSAGRGSGGNRPTLRERPGTSEEKQKQPPEQEPRRSGNQEEEGENGPRQERGSSGNQDADGKGGGNGGVSDARGERGVEEALAGGAAAGNPGDAPATGSVGDADAGVSRCAYSTSYSVVMKRLWKGESRRSSGFLPVLFEGVFKQPKKRAKELGVALRVYYSSATNRTQQGYKWALVLHKNCVVQ